MVQKILLTLTILFSLIACQNETQEEHDAKVAEKAKAELRVELKKEADEKAKQREIAVAKNNSMAHIGITTTNGKLIIDTNKTKAYFDQIASTFKSHADKFVNDMNKGIIDDKEAGIEVNKTNINIDLNKTKSFLEAWGKTIDSYTTEFKKFTDTIQKSLTKENNATN